MSITLEKVASYLGQVVQDVYGRKIGSVVGVYSEIDGTVTAIEVMINDSTYETIPAEKLEFKDDGLRILPEWLVEAQKLEKKLDTLRKRVKALEELHKKGQIPQHAYKELKEKFDRELGKARGDAKNIKDVMRKRLYDLENFIIHVEKAMTNLMVSYTSGELPENGFKISADFMRYAKQTAIEEKKDIEKHVNTITKLEEELSLVIKSLEESAQQKESILSVATQPGPIAVKVTS